MIKISVASYNNAPSVQPLSFTFDELGGTIGRADTNQLILPDPERSISRVHAQVVYRNGRFSVIDKGSNPISVNGRALGNGTEAPIQPGDQLQIGGYLLLVEASQAAGGMMAPAAPAPAAGGGFGNDPFGFGSPAADPFGASAPAAPSPRPAAAPPSNDPFAGFWSPSPSPAAPPPGPAPAAGGIPDDWDPFGASPAPSAPAPAPAGGDPLAMFGAPTAGQITKSAESSIDNLFGLGPATGADPFSNSPLGAGLGGPNTAADLDPLRSLGQQRDAGQAAMSDQGSDLNTPFIAQRAAVPPAAPAPAPTGGGGAMLPDDFDFLSPSPAPSAPAAPAFPGGPLGGAAPPARTAAAPAPDAPSTPSGAVLSWGDSGGGMETRTVIKPKRPAGDDPAGMAAPSPAGAALDPLAAFALPPGSAGAGTTPAAGSAGFSSPAADAWGSPAQRPAAVPAATPAALPPTAPLQGGLGAPIAATAAARAPSAAAMPPAGGLAASPDMHALLEAFKEGLASPTVSVEALTPEFMKLLGQLVRESAQGTVDLLVARAALKREVRAEMTMIVAQKNNPLKFSPTVEVALGHLLSPPQRGFMPAVPAMQDAYDDLRAHQFGTMAGMRAALDGVLKRFDPAQLEGKLTQKSVLSTLLPASRKARMWEVFQELYAQISAEASDDFHELFGKEFLKAYENYIDQLHNDRHSASRSDRPR